MMGSRLRGPLRVNALQSETRLLMLSEREYLTGHVTRGAFGNGDYYAVRWHVESAYGKPRLYTWNSPRLAFHIMMFSSGGLLSGPGTDPHLRCSGARIRMS